MLPQSVMAQAQQELINFQQLGVSVMEISHRGSTFMKVAEETERNLRQLLTIPDDYAVLFMHGGARGQFAAVPLNLLPAGQRALYLQTGQWSLAATEEAQKFGEIESRDLRDEQGGLDLTKIGATAEFAYVHYCPNETVDGNAIFEIPEVDAPLVADMSSCILGRQIDVRKFAVIYAGAQKNIGPAGLTLVIIRRDLLGRAAAHTPAILNYQLTADFDSMYNTPPTFAWYLAGEVFKWIGTQGGVAAMEKANHAKAAALYEYIDNSGFYHNHIAPAYRSEMNVTFKLANPELDSQFVIEAEQQGLLALKGHRLVGGMRASIYNAMPMAGVKALIAFMEQFAIKHGYFHTFKLQTINKRIILWDWI